MDRSPPARAADGPLTLSPVSLPTRCLHDPPRQHKASCVLRSGPNPWRASSRCRLHSHHVPAERSDIEMPSASRWSEFPLLLDVLLALSYPGSDLPISRWGFVPISCRSLLSFSLVADFPPPVSGLYVISFTSIISSLSTHLLILAASSFLSAAFRIDSGRPLAPPP